MKKHIFILACIFFAACPVTLGAEHNPNANTLINTTDDRSRADRMLDRLNEIDKMDKSNLTQGQKHQLRHEVVAIRESLQDIGGGLYLSFGAIVIILILLIILL